MNLNIIDSDLEKKILEWVWYIGLFVHQRKYYWIIDWNEHFNLDHLQNIDTKCSNPRSLEQKPAELSVEQWRQRMINDYRGGIPTLTTELFPRYRDGKDAKVVTTEVLRNFLWSVDHGQLNALTAVMENYLSFGKEPTSEMEAELDNLYERLPKFYVNFDRKIFLHMCDERDHEAVVPDDWWAAKGDFLHMIPASHRYWRNENGLDLWTAQKFH